MIEIRLIGTPDEVDVTLAVLHQAEAAGLLHVVRVGPPQPANRGDYVRVYAKARVTARTAPEATT